MWRHGWKGRWPWWPGTRGAGRGIAVELGAAGATVYVTGRSTRATLRVRQARNHRGNGGTRRQGRRARRRHPGGPPEPDEVQDLVGRIEGEQGRLDVLVNDVWGSEHLMGGTCRCGNTPAEGTPGCSGSPSTRTSRPATSPCPYSSRTRADWSSR